MEKNQREFYLNEQMRAIQKELGHSEEGRTELDELEEKIKKRGMARRRTRRPRRRSRSFG